MVRQLREINIRKGTVKRDIESNKLDLYHDIKFQGKILEKKRMFERLNQENQRLANTIKQK
jgi:hypothetical protein